MTEIELLAIIETLKEFKGMLWGQQLIVYTDHQNLMRERLILEEYGPGVPAHPALHLLKRKMKVFETARN